MTNAGRPFSLSNTAIRLATADETPRWEAIMAERHALGFHGLFGQGLRYVAEADGVWLALAGWQAAALKSAPRDSVVGWTPKQREERLRHVANNTRLLFLSEPGSAPNLGSHFVGGMLRRLSDDWRRTWGYPLELAETFVDPALYEGTVYRASNWRKLGRTKGHARVPGGYSEPHGRPKEILIYPLGRSSLARLSAPEPHPDWETPTVEVEISGTSLRSLMEETARMPDRRRKQGRRHRQDTVLAICVLARLAGHVGPLATSRYAQSLSQEFLEALNARRNRTGDYIPPSLSTVFRALSRVDGGELHAVACRWAEAHPAPPRVDWAKPAADDKRIDGAARTGRAQ